MTISNPTYHQDPIDDPLESLEKSQTDFMTFSEEKFKQDLVYYAFLITSSKYLEVPYLPKRFLDED